MDQQFGRGPVLDAGTPVALEADGVGAEFGIAWSVVVKGPAERAIPRGPGHRGYWPRFVPLAWNRKGPSRQDRARVGYRRTLHPHLIDMGRLPRR